MLIIFDLDGVLIESKEMHFRTLNLALEDVHKKYVIDYQDHLDNYDGLSTKKKLEILSIKKGLSNQFYDMIQQKKQELTIDWIKKISVNNNLISLFSKLKEQKIKIAVASNSVSNTVKTSLICLQLIEFIDYYVSNEDVFRTKPFPEMYWKCMTRLDSLPNETIILEDSPIGRQGAINSGAFLLPIDDPKDVTLELIYQKINEIKI